jgi:hypothetical protein
MTSIARNGSLDEGALAMTGYRLRLAIGAALGGAKAENGRGRGDIAAVMSWLAGYAVSKQTLDRWAAPGNEEHRMPAELLPALVAATGDTGPLETLAEACGLRLVDARLAEIGRAYLAKLDAEQALAEALADPRSRPQEARR